MISDILSMVQGFKKNNANKGTSPKSSIKKQVKPSKVKKGSSLKLPNGKFREAALQDRALSKAIDKANEKKVAAKLLQAGGKLSTTDIKAAGKELNKDLKRKMLKRKLTRVEEKLQQIKEHADS